MKTILRLSAFCIAAALSGAIACGGSSGGCGGGSGSSSSNTGPVITCGPGTVQQGDTCVATAPAK